MLAEIFMLRLEAAARAAKEAANSSRFVPITLPTAKASRSKPNSKENAPTRHARATGRDLSSAPSWSEGANDQLTNAGTRRPVRVPPMPRQ
jgi:hypothetical protein